jgi:cellobiose-specific phosphotransferase system component IIA
MTYTTIALSDEARYDLGQALDRLIEAEEEAWEQQTTSIVQAIDRLTAAVEKQTQALSYDPILEPPSE